MCLGCIFDATRLLIRRSHPRVGAKPAQPDCFEHGWVGDPALDPSERGLVVLGVPIGSPDFVRKHLRLTLERQASLLDQLPALEDAQVAWLLLSLSLRSGTAAWVSAVPSGTRRLRIGLLGQTASSFLHAVSPPLLNACRRPWRAATRYHLPWTPFAWPATPCPPQVLSCPHGKTCCACLPPNSMMMSLVSFGT